MNSKNKNIEKLESILISSKHFFCISHFNGELDWIKKINKSNYVVYNKSNKKLDKEINSIKIKNVGYNIYSYLNFIIENYENLPDTIVFCKDNIFSRHLKIKTFSNLLKRNIFTCLEENNISRPFPISVDFSDNSFNEINSSWYRFKHPRKFFSNYDIFYNYVFKNTKKPLFIRFAPGANYIVPKNNILLRTKNFYKNLKKFIDHSQYSCESHFVERSLFLIWNSNLESSDNMDKIVSKINLKYLENNCENLKQKEFRILEKIFQKVIFKIGSIYFSFLSKVLYK